MNTNHLRVVFLCPPRAGFFTSKENMQSSSEGRIIQLLEGLGRDQNARHSENTDHLQRLEEMIKEGFPDGDAEAHRKYHEALIRKAEERTRFYAELRVKLAEKGIWAVIVVLATAVYWYVREGPKQ
ncbi:hypothetical protein PQR63_23070 [Herbaspirillum rhizosphaerae]|uniref:Uncharacterized protein n=1 Tax=Herbaspirillum rhizosphaerae TaxID=346179 RepID=A0ABW8ZG01_9BURK